MSTIPAPTNSVTSASPLPSTEIEAKIPSFSELSDLAGQPAVGALDNLLEVTCTVTAELGRTQMCIGEVLKLTIGSILELNRLVSEPVDVIVQGVRLARGEVVVVDDHFAIRIKEIVDPKRRING